MVVFLIRAFIFVVSAALGLWITSLVVDDFHVQGEGFLVAVLIFAVLQSILTPWLAVMARRHANALIGGIGLVSTFVALWLTTLFTDALTIDTAQAWLLGTFIVWVVTMLGALLLPLVLLRNHRQERKAQAA